MNYEKKYKDALKRAKDNYNAADITDINVNSFKATLIDLFPELKEGEDERIRKEILEFFCQFENGKLRGVDISSWIAWLEKQGEQKPANKVGPKFRVGQWIVWYDKCYKVNYNGCGYELVDQNGLRTSLEYVTFDENAHLWTIQDAKDGDVLECDMGVFIFQREYIAGKPTAYCGIVNGHFIIQNQDGVGQMNNVTQQQKNSVIL